MQYQYSWLPGSLVQPTLLEDLSALYSAHYGTWSRRAPKRAGEPVRLSSGRIQELLAPRDSKVALATLDGELVGYAIAIQTNIPKYGFVSWVTQLVVHEEHRRNDVGKTLLFSIWNFSSHFAWGLITANPYAVRALEKATRRRCQPIRIVKNKRKLVNLALKNVAYVTKGCELEVNRARSRINTQFFVDHSGLATMLDSVITGNTPWNLGPLDEGWEWFAFTFHDQQEIGLTPEEIEKMLKASDQVARQAYSRMLLTEQAWARHTREEVSLIIEYCALAPGAKILDFGCGTGRHVIGLLERGFECTGIDYVENLITSAIETTQAKGLLRARFQVNDCRTVDLGEQFDAVIALYDIIGTYADDGENKRIIQNISKHLKPNGKALISVMNLDLTARKAKHFFALNDEPDRLLKLAPSQTMERTGDIFNPEYYMIGTTTSVVYRKEQFAAGSELPVELIVRDRRYRKSDIEDLCRSSGLDVLWARCVRAGAWQTSLECSDDHAKEILLLCRKARAGWEQRS
jgi:2-polyprenyl-3-methyl-5-hydroxy-6-metoxy-1,4-benzoquinol methylase/GNAT superfamily N-acetyltransferase